MQESSVHKSIRSTIQLLFGAPPRAFHLMEQSPLKAALSLNNHSATFIQDQSLGTACVQQDFSDGMKAKQTVTIFLLLSAIFSTCTSSSHRKNRKQCFCPETRHSATGIIILLSLTEKICLPMEHNTLYLDWRLFKDFFFGKYGTRFPPRQILKTNPQIQKRIDYTMCAHTETVMQPESNPIYLYSQVIYIYIAKYRRLSHPFSI